MSEYLDNLVAEMEANGTAPRIVAKPKRKSSRPNRILTIREAAPGAPYSYEKNGRKYLMEYIGLAGTPVTRPDDPNFPTGQMSYDTFPYGAMSEAPEETKNNGVMGGFEDPNGETYWKGLSRMRVRYAGEVGTPDSNSVTYYNPKDGKYYYWTGVAPEMPQERDIWSFPTTGLVETSDADYLIPQRPIIDWDEEAKKDAEEVQKDAEEAVVAPVSVPDDVGVSYAGGLSDYAIDPEQVRSATNAYAPDQATPAAVDPMQYLSANGLLPLDLENVKPEAEKEAIPTWARVALGLADALRISGTRGGLFPETAVEDKNARIGGTTSELIDNMKKEVELDKAIRANDLARAKILSQAAMSETDPARKAEYGKAIKRLLPRETQGLDDITAAGMFTGDDKIALEREKQKGRMDLQTLKNLAALDQLSAKGVQASGLEDQKSQNRIEETRAKFAEQTKLEQLKTQGRAELNAQKHADALELQGKKDEAAYVRALAQIDAKLKAASLKGTGGGVSQEQVDFWKNKANLEPDEGVVEAIKTINENRDMFSPTSSALDTKVGRTLPLLISNNTIAVRNKVKAKLNSLVRESAKNLMQLFPKGGASVINTATEARLWNPIAQAIDSGEWTQIIPFVEEYYGNMYDAAKAVANEEAPISRQEYINLMTKGATSGGLTSISMKQKTDTSSGNTIRVGKYNVTVRD